MRKNLSPPEYNYRGRFSPSPTGPLHFGSLVAAIVSYLDAKSNQGIWVVRMEDLDTPRCTPEAADDILRTLEAFGLDWDEKVIYQSQRTAAYEEALQQLQNGSAIYPCCCTRKEISDSAMLSNEGLIYPGTCRNGVPSSRQARTWRVRTDSQHFPSTPIHSHIEFADVLQGPLMQHLENEIGDFIVKRADGLFAYQLAVVVDDAFQNITHVVRGSDLITSTPRQIHLQHLLKFPTPTYMHLPIAVNEQGEKLSKQTLAPSIGVDEAVTKFLAVLTFLRQQPPDELLQGSIEEVLNWAILNWKPERLVNCRQLPALSY
ncbi:MAG: tRNA glutamyl-Q(34) synthetase GluQRS [Gallionella sp.]